MPSTTVQVRSFLAKYSPAIAADVQFARRALKRLVPRGFELVYDNYNTLAFGISPTPRAGGAIVSIAAYPQWVTLFFLHGKGLKDPEGLLQGGGARVRSIRLSPVRLINTEPVQALLRQALEPHQAELAVAPRLSSIVKSVSARQRPRRPALRKG
ncbi:MAG TPA: DUF1801 domain-containing protein [Steroidobacteraceae bacterium]|jgi:hypothetical protein|nr:DUF1801 domain-containing protein [Steroidobacteraceae bacterium]